MSSLQWFDAASPPGPRREPPRAEERRESSMSLKGVSGSKAAGDIDAIVAATMEAERAGGGQSARASKVSPPSPTVDKSATSSDGTSVSNNKKEEDDEAPTDASSRAFTLQEAGQSMDHALKAKQKLIQEHISDHEKKLVDQHLRLKKVRQKLDRLEQDQAAEIGPDAAECRSPQSGVGPEGEGRPPRRRRSWRKPIRSSIGRLGSAAGGNVTESGQWTVSTECVSQYPTDELLLNLLLGLVSGGRLKATEQDLRGVVAVLSAGEMFQCYLAAAESLDACKKEKTETERVLMELLLKAGESRDKVMNEMLQSLDTL
ncbi:hypothetical protein FOZ60_013918 [Perkinsus olseni]|uniref:Uncharacterized protein n=1 Tax=Perkinsus olseni TaxID=32597 RepID=A0A7J6P7V1_PEROL|nr:hypothetical protein FOZ60_013918 [Perkinsus olseni]